MSAPALVLGRVIPGRHAHVREAKLCPVGGALAFNDRPVSAGVPDSARPVT